MATIAILTGSHLCTNPRAVKEAIALAGAGHDVTVFGAWHTEESKRADKALLKDFPAGFVAVSDATASGLSAALGRHAARARKAMARARARYSGIESGMQIGLDPSRMLALARRTSAQLYIAHSELALLAAQELERDGRRVGVDMEDWFSEDLLPEAREARPLSLIRSAERALLQRCAYSACTSAAMAETLAAEYDCRLPTVVYNAFPWADRRTLDGAVKDRKDRSIPSIHWYSQTLGPGRGLEDLVAALPFVAGPAEIHLRGQWHREFVAWLRERVPPAWRERVFFHGIVPGAELLSRIAEHDVGFAGEQKYCRSRDLTVTNKILSYLLAGLAVVASDTAGQREVAARAENAVSLYPAGDVAALAQALNHLLSSPDALRSQKEAALKAAEQSFAWERHEATLVEAVAHALRT